MNHADLICLLCMREKQSPGQIPCPYCGGDDRTLPVQSPALPPRTVLDNRYVLGKTLGQGGFGITYKAYDIRMHNTVAVKEYFPSSIVGRDSTVTNTVTVNAVKGGRAQTEYASGLRHFLNEARRQARMASSPGVVTVTDFFEANNTAYYVMEYVDGYDLVKYMRESQPLDEVIALLEPIAQSLEQIHASGMIHRDISPDNIMCAKNGSRKLLDFGASHSFTEDESTTGNATLKHGFAPPEQYGSSNMQGPWTDVYAFAATIYWCITGKVPQDSMDRSIGGDHLKKPIELGAILTPEAEKVLLRGMTLAVTARYQDMRSFWSALKKANAQKPAAAESAGTPTEKPEQTVVSTVVTKTEKPSYYYEEPEETVKADWPVNSQHPAPEESPFPGGNVGRQENSRVPPSEEPEATVLHLDTEPVIEWKPSGNHLEDKPPEGEAGGGAPPEAPPPPEEPERTEPPKPFGHSLTQWIMLAVIVVLAVLLVGVLWHNKNLTGDTSTSWPLWENQDEETETVTVAGEEVPLDATELYITGNASYTTQRFSNMSFIEAESLTESDMAAIGELKELRTLYLVDLELNDLSALASLKNLTQLCLYGNAITDLSPLSKLSDLTWLDLGNNKITSVSELSGLTNLVRLYLQNNAITDLTGLEELTGVETLNLTNNHLENADALQQMQSLNILYVAGCGLTQRQLAELVEALPECVLDVDVLTDIPEYVKIGDISYSTSTTAIYLDNMDLTDSELANLKYMVDLTVLDLSGNRISNLNLLSGLTALTTLYLDSTNVEDISALSDLFRLEKLSLSNTSVSDLSPLEELTAITSLDLSGTDVEDLSGISDLTSITTLNISNTPVTDLSPIAGLEELNLLIMVGCNVEDMTQLYELTSLKEIRISRGMYDEEVLDALKENLPGCAIVQVDG